MKEDVLPMMEKIAKKRNCKVSHIRQITCLFAMRDDFGDHRLLVGSAVCSNM